MLLRLLKSKIHRATVTRADLNYEGSISICPDLIQVAGLRAHESVDVLNVMNGERFTTYVIAGDRGGICVNGAAARLVQPGDLVIVVAYALMTPEEADVFQPAVVLVDSANQALSLRQHSGE